MVSTSSNFSPKSVDDGEYFNSTESMGILGTPSIIFYRFHFLSRSKNSQTKKRSSVQRERSKNQNDESAVWNRIQVNIQVK